MLRTAITFLPIIAIWIALSLACALRVGRRRRTGQGQVAADPFFHPFGEMPELPHGNSIHQRFFHSAGLALRPEAGGAGLLRTGPGAARDTSDDPFEGCWKCGRHVD